MKPLTEPELLEARDDLAAALLTDAAVLSRRVETRDSSGGFTAVWTTVWTGMGRLGAPSSSEVELAYRMDHTTSAVVTLPAEVAVKPDDRVTIRGTTFDVFSIAGRRTTELVTRVLVAEVA